MGCIWVKTYMNAPGTAPLQPEKSSKSSDRRCNPKRGWKYSPCFDQASDMTIKNRTFIVAVCWSVIASVQLLNAQNKQAFEVSKNFNILHTLYGELNQFYVDSVKPEVALGRAIEGLMSAYDPYTNYIAEAETDELKFITTGEYGGVGAIIGQRNGRVLVLEQIGRAHV